MFSDETLASLHLSSAPSSPIRVADVELLSTNGISRSISCCQFVVLSILASEKVGADWFDVTGTSGQGYARPCNNKPKILAAQAVPQTLQPCIHEAGVSHVD